MKNHIILKRISYLVVAAIFSVSLLACNQTASEPDNSNILIEEVTGTYFVQTFVGDRLVVDYESINIYNTANNTAPEMWIDDNEHIWPFKVKSAINLNDLTFSGMNLESEFLVEDKLVTITITNGKITKGDTETTGGNISDGITFDAEFSDDPGTIYSIKGYKHTGFVNDLH